MSDVTLRMYQFLSTQEDWMTTADKNSDGVIIKEEFRSYMLDSDFDWQSLDAYDTSKSEEANQKDIINNFWKTIDTEKGGKAVSKSGKTTRLKNTNSLGKKELETMELKIAVYEQVGLFCKDIEAPNCVTNEQRWKESVQEGICNKIENEFIKSGKTLEDLQAYLEEISPLIQNKATADYCYQEYIVEAGSELIQKYGYAYGDDKSLKSIIDNYINEHLTADSEPEDIQNEIEEIIDAYIATIDEGIGDTSILAEYGYDVDTNPKINYLQETVIRSNAKNNIVNYLQTLSNNGENLYSNYQQTFDSAIEDFLTRTLKSAKYDDFDSLAELSGADFAQEKEFKSAYNVAVTEDLFKSIDLYNAVKENISEVFANKIFKVSEDGKHISYALMKGEFKAYENIYKQAIEKAKNGELGDLQNNGISSVVDYVTKEIKSHITDFYGSDWGDMSLGDLKVTYEILEDAAFENEDIKALRKAALQYCKAVSSKNIGLANAIEQILGKTYVQFMTEAKNSSDIRTAMQKVVAKVMEMGDASTFELLDSSWGDLKETIYMAEGTTGEGTSFQLKPEFKDRTVDPSRITYECDNSDIMTVNDSGLVQLNSSAKCGSYDATVTIKCDGVVGTKKVHVEVKTEKEIKEIAESKGRSSADYTWCAVYQGCRQFFDHLGLKTVGTVIGAVAGGIAAGAVAVAKGIASAAKSVWKFITSW